MVNTNEETVREISHSELNIAVRDSLRGNVCEKPLSNEEKAVRTFAHHGILTEEPFLFTNVITCYGT